MQTLTRAVNLVLIMLLLGMIFTMSGCSKTDDNGQTVGQKVDGAIDKANDRSAQASKRLEEAASKAGDKIEQGANEAETAIKDAAASAKDKSGEITSVVDDSAITASVKADLLKDPSLSALSVDVSTDKGEVTLKGKVDNEAARQRAATLAAAVSGVHKVNNQLQVAANDKSTGKSA